MPGVTVDGNDVLAIYECCEKAIQRARAGEGPTLVECKTYRWRGHHEGDINQGGRYRTMDEVQEWMKKCPIKRFGEKLVRERTLDNNQIEQIYRDIGRKIDEAVEFANQSPFPDPKDLYEDVYVPLT
jgi:pyruvate dehydrogenase E1 component alpha subunit